MNSKDILIVTRCFWPQSGLTELAISDLAINLKAAGHSVTIATVRWLRQWSEKIEYHGIPVVRFAKPVHGPWSSFRYARLLSKHLSTKSYDAVIVSGVGDEAAAAIRCVDELTPVIIRLDDNLSGVNGSFHRKHIECCLSADAVVANSHQVASQLNRIEEMPPVCVIPDGIRSQRNRLSSSVNKRQARHALNVAHPVMQIESNQPLAIAFVPFETGNGLVELVDNWTRVLKRLPKAKLWLLGDGPGSSQVWQRIVQKDIVHAVVMPGYFDNLNDLFSAADLYIHPSSSEVSSDGLLRALAAGIPTVSTQNDELKNLVAWYPLHQLDPNADWSRIILDQLIDHDLDQQQLKTAELRELICQHHSPEQQVHHYLQLMQSAITDQVAVAK